LIAGTNLDAQLVLLTLHALAPAGAGLFGCRCDACRRLFPGCRRPAARPHYRCREKAEGLQLPIRNRLAVADRLYHGVGHLLHPGDDAVGRDACSNSNPERDDQQTCGRRALTQADSSCGPIEQFRVHSRVAVLCKLDHLGRHMFCGDLAASLRAGTRAKPAAQ
jgi:hypothetical protein